MKEKHQNNTDKYTHVEHTFCPVYDKNTRILILGSFPSVKSREESFYYGHPQNRFWKVISAICKCGVPASIEEKKSMLINNSIGLYDVIFSCDIIGSSDSSIKNVIPCDIKTIIANSSIEYVLANGKTAAKLYQKFIENETEIPIIELPSTSPANAAYSLEKLIAVWSERLML